YGDILVLKGNGDGTFSYLAAPNISLAVAHLNPSNPNEDDFVYADQSLNQVAIQYGGRAPTVFQSQANRVLLPGTARLANLNDDHTPDLIVADSGRNTVLVYPGLGNGKWGPELNGGQGFQVGDDPVGITVGDVKVDAAGNKTLGLVIANEGSNDVSVLYVQQPV